MNGVAAPRVSAESRCWPARRSRHPHSVTTTGWMPARATRRLTPFALLAGLLAPAAAGAQSAEPEAVPRLDPVVVTVTRMEQKASEAPAAVTVLTGEDLRTSAGQTLDDVLRQVPGFSLFRRSSSVVGHPTTQGVSLRGIGPSGTSRALVLLDDVPINDPFGGWVYWNRIPLARHRARRGGAGRRLERVGQLRAGRGRAHREPAAHRARHRRRGERRHRRHDELRHPRERGARPRPPELRGELLRHRRLPRGEGVPARLDRHRRGVHARLGHPPGGRRGHPRPDAVPLRQPLRRGPRQRDPAADQHHAGWRARRGRAPQDVGRQRVGDGALRPHPGLPRARSAPRPRTGTPRRSPSTSGCRPPRWAPGPSGAGGSARTR